MYVLKRLYVLKQVLKQRGGRSDAVYVESGEFPKTVRNLATTVSQSVTMEEIAVLISGMARKLQR